MVVERVMIRPATRHDADDIGEAHASAWERAFTHLLDPGFLARSGESRRTGWCRMIDRMVVPSNVLLVAEVHGAVRAFGHGAPTADPGTAEVRAFYAHPDVWGTGAAETLMRSLLSVLAGHAPTVMLWTPRGAPRARRFYEKSGFSLTGETRVDTVTDWTTGDGAHVDVVQYGRRV
jgi:GNAT superfamily N-acetyltransferase